VVIHLNTLEPLLQCLVQSTVLGLNHRTVDTLKLSRATPTYAYGDLGMNDDDDDKDKHRELRLKGLAYLRLRLQKMVNVVPSFAWYIRSTVHVMGQAILRPLPPRPYVPGRRRLQI
jgi:hypothetical protein